MKEKTYNTKYVDLGFGLFCAYCGKKMNHEESFLDHYDSIDYFNCDCEEANKEREIHLKVEKVEQELRAIKNGLPTEKIKKGDYIRFDEKENRIVKIEDKNIIKI